MSARIIILRPGDAERVDAMDASAGAIGEGLTASHRFGLGVEDPSGRLVAYLIASLTPDLADIEALYVSPERRREGLAVRLIAGLSRHAGERGIARIGLDVAETNVAARALYNRLGFEIDHVRHRYYRDGANALVMSRPINSFTGLEP